MRRGINALFLYVYEIITSFQEKSYTNWNFWCDFLYFVVFWKIRVVKMAFDLKNLRDFFEKVPQ